MIKFIWIIAFYLAWPENNYDITENIIHNIINSIEIVDVKYKKNILFNENFKKTRIS